MRAVSGDGVRSTPLGVGAGRCRTRGIFAAMATHMEIVLRAAAFAAEKHRNGRRKDAEASPYINHPIQLAYILVQADIEDPVVLAAALLHDTIEDTSTTHDEIEIVFGHEIA